MTRSANFLASGALGTVIVATAAALTVLAATSGSTNPLFRQFDAAYNPLVPLTHCARFGPLNDLMLEWQLHFAPKWTLEMRFTSDAKRGFAAIGFANDSRRQLITGSPIENLHCARQLFDTYSPYDIYGNVYPNFPEVPAKVAFVNTSHTILYMMRNLSISSRQFLEKNPTSAQLNLTLMWSYMQQSLFNAGCYMSDVEVLTEYANFNISLGDPYYLQGTTGCRVYEGDSKVSGTGRILDESKELLLGEYFQNHRVAAMLLGGELMVEAGTTAPQFSGWVRAGDEANGVCSAVTSTVYARWEGFSQAIGGIVKYEVTVGTATFPALFVARYDAGTNLAVTLPVAGMHKNHSYIVRVTAYDFAGLTKTVIAKPVRVLNNGLPIWGTLFMASPGNQRASFQANAHTLIAIMSGWVNEDHAAKNYDTGAFTDNGFWFAIGDKTSLTGIQGWTFQPTYRSRITVTGLSLTNAASYTVSVRSTNCAGKTTQQTSNTMTVDLVPPSGGIIRVGNSSKVHAPYITLHTRLAVWWWGFTDYISGIGAYEWAISTSTTPPVTNGGAGVPGMVKPWMSVGHATRATNTTLSAIGATNALVGQNIYFHVKAVDNVGNFFIKTSNATRVVGL